MTDAQIVLTIIWGIVTGGWLLGWGVWWVFSVVDNGWDDEDSIKAARMTLIAPLWPLALVAGVILLFASAIGVNPRQALRDRAENRRLEQLRRESQRQQRIRELESELGIGQDDPPTKSLTRRRR